MICLLWLPCKLKIKQSDVRDNVSYKYNSLLESLTSRSSLLHRPRMFTVLSLCFNAMLLEAIAPHKDKLMFQRVSPTFQHLDQRS